MTSFVVNTPLPQFGLWDELEGKNIPASFEFELTARCNNDCRHCYINLPAGDRAARASELSFDEIVALADQAVELGALWCLLTGGEPLLRPDFSEIYVALKKRGLLVSVFTNACLLKQEHVDLFRRYPPRDVEITMYGASRETYKRVTRAPGSFDAFVRGARLLEQGGVRARYKAMALRSNIHEFAAMAEFGRAHTKDYFRFDFLLHLRYDRDPERNAEICAERLAPAEIAAIELSDEERVRALRRECRVAAASDAPAEPDRIFQCGVGGGFTVGYDGLLRLCSSLWHPDYVADVRREPLAAAWRRLVSRARTARTRDAAYLNLCAVCRLTDLCLYCPAHLYLENGSLTQPIDDFCVAARARARTFGDAPAEGSGAVQQEKS
jgi:radical SAM protein with 4Fe4S-binding SPASM domain